MELNNPKVNKVMADKAVEYLKNRMQLNQEIIKVKFSPDKLINFEEFMEKYNSLEKQLSEIETWSDPKLKILKDAKNELIRNFADGIVLTEEQIDELMALIRRSIETCGLGGGSCGENHFVRGALRDLKGDLRENIPRVDLSEEEKTILNKWIDYVYVSDSVGFCTEIAGFFNCSYDDKFSIHNRNGKMCEVDINGNLTVYESLEDETILLLTNLYVGYDNNEYYIFLERNIDGQKIMDAYNSYGSYAYYFEEDMHFIKDLIPLYDYLKLKGLDFLIKPIYAEDKFTEILSVIYNYKFFSPEEIESMEKVIDVAVNWWANKLFNNTGIQEELINKFKVFLGNEIRIKLCVYQGFEVGVDYRADEALYEAVKNAQLMANFPFKTFMHISCNEVSVRFSEQNETEILYSSEKSRK